MDSLDKRPKRKKMDMRFGTWNVRKIGWDGTDWIDLTQGRDQWKALVNTGDEPSGSIKCWEVLEWLHNWQLLKKDPAP
jgi:hypothetical protein